MAKKYSKVHRKVLREEVSVPTSTAGVRETHTIWAPAGYRVVSAGHVSQEEGDPSIANVFSSFPVHDDSAPGQNGWRWFYYTTGNNVLFHFFVIVESIYEADEQVTL